MQTHTEKKTLGAKKVACLTNHIAKSLCVVKSIPKDARGDMSRSDNYRGIALCNCICKLFDIILMKKYSDVLCTSDQQFAFKANHSTTLCTGILIETASHFVNNNSCVYSCFLDASKAFDKVHYGKLFNLMLKRSVPSVIVRFILDGYTRHRMCAQWERHTSRTFHVCNGVKQGAVISPILFAVYYDELIAKLASSGYGCRISQHFVGALSYADDITLLSPSLKGLQYMVNICEEYGKEFHVTFNDKKTTGAKIIKKTQNSTQNKRQTYHAKQYKVTTFLSTDCELSTNPCSKNVYNLGPRNGVWHKQC